MDNKVLMILNDIPSTSPKKLYDILNTTAAKGTDSEYEIKSAQNRQLLTWSAHVHPLDCSFVSAVIALPISYLADCFLKLGILYTDAKHFSIAEVV